MDTLEHYGIKRLTTNGVTLLGILLAIELILKRFTIGPDVVKISLVFVVTTMIAYWFGPMWSAIVAATGDILGTALSGQPIFIGFTLSAVVGALIYSFAFYNKKSISLVRVIITSIITAILVNLFMNTLWVSMLYNADFWAYFNVRLVKNLFTTPIQIVIIYLVLNYLPIQNVKQKIFK